MTEIASRAGASIGSLYQFFPTKELLARALHETYLADLSAMLDGLRQQAPGRSATGMADLLFDALSLFLTEHSAFSALAERRDLDREQKRRTGAAMREQIADMLASASPPIPPPRSQAIAAVVLQMMKVVVALSSEDMEQGSAVRAELRQMLKSHLSAAQVA